MDFKKHFELAWNLTIKNIFSLVIMTLVFLVVSGLTFGILFPVCMAGYTQSVLLLVRKKREPKVQDLFAHMNLFLPLLGFGICASILIFIGSLLLVIPGILVSLFITFSTIFMMPLMTDKGLKLNDAVKRSFNVAFEKQHMMDHAIMIIIYLALMCVGGTIVVGSLFTFPLATIFIMSIYNDRL